MSENKEKLPGKLGMKETSPGSGLYAITGDPEDFWKSLVRRGKGKIVGLERKNDNR